MPRTFRYKYGSHHFRNITYARLYCARTKQSLALALADNAIKLGDPPVERDETFEWSADGRAIISVWEVEPPRPVAVINNSNRA